MTPKQFALLIEKRASKKRISHMEAVLDYCQEKEIESAGYVGLSSTMLLSQNQKEIPLEIIEIQTGNYLGEDDIIRLEDDFERN